MSSVLILVVVIAALAMFFDQKRRSEIREKNTSTEKNVMTEDEAPPTATGRMKVQPVLQAIKQKHQPPPADPNRVSASSKVLGEEEDEALPDPFASGANKRPQR